MRTLVAEMARAGRPTVRISFASASMPVSSSNSKYAEFSDRVEHCFLRWIMRKDGLLRLRQDKSEDRRVKKNAGHELTDHRGLAEALSSFPNKRAVSRMTTNCGDESRL